MALPPQSARPPHAPFDVSLFKSEQRIHVQDSSHFTKDQMIVLHPAELAPENEQRLIGKLLKHYSIPYVHFTMVQPRGTILTQLATLIPPSAEVELKEMQSKLDQLKQSMGSGENAEFAKKAERHKAPFDSLSKWFGSAQDMPSSFKYMVEQTTTLYLVLNEALQQWGYPQEAASYVRIAHTPDQVLSELSEKLGIAPREFSEVVRQSGVEGLAKRLGVLDANFQEIKQVSALMAANSFSNNIYENWRVGRQQPNMQQASLQDKLVGGIQSRIAHTVQGYRDRQRANFSVPEGVEAVEDKMVASLRLLPPELAEALYVSGTEFAYTPRGSLASFDPSYASMAGYHQFIPYQSGSHLGVRQIFVSARANEREFDEVVMHEAHHLFFPMQFSPEERRAIDGLIQKAAERFNGERGLRALSAAWKASVSESQRAAVEAEIDERFGVQGLRLKEALGSNSMHNFGWAVDDAWRNLDPNSDSLTRSYHEPEFRVAELISRYAELKHIRLRDNPAMLDFIAPEFKQIYEQYYVPHLRKQTQLMQEEQQIFPAALQNMAMPIPRKGKAVFPNANTQQPEANTPSALIEAPSTQLQGLLPFTVAQSLDQPSLPDAHFVNKVQESFGNGDQALLR